MSSVLLLGSIVILSCLLCSKFSNKAGLPMLLVFMVLGMLFGSDGLLKISFNDYAFAEEVCTFTLIIIMFYGGFGTNWSAAKPVAKKAVALSSLGVLITAGTTGLFCYYVLHFPLLEGLLMGAVISSTDAASVFSILRSKKLNLKNNTASLLEVESGSNDPVAYTLTLLLLALMNGQGDWKSMAAMAILQLFYAAVFGVLISWGALFILKHHHFTMDGFDAAFVIAIAVLSYALPTYFGGNGFLCAYIVGIIVGNRPIAHKATLVHFFDGITGLMQMTLFFILGLLATPSQIPAIFIPAVCIGLFLTFVARPLSVLAVLAPLRSPLNSQLLVAWAGLRGAASTVFAMIAVVNEAFIQSDIFHITFCIVLLSIAIQGTLLPTAAKWLKMIDNNANVLKTFNDYQEEEEVLFVKLSIFEDHPWIGQTPKDLILPPESLLVMILRNNQTIIPKGNTFIYQGDIVVLSAPAYHDNHNIHLHELLVYKNHPWEGHLLREVEIEPGALVIMIRRNKKIVVPNGNTRILENDICVLNLVLA